MRNWWRKFRQFTDLSLQDQLLVVQAGVLLLVIKAGLGLLSFQQFRRLYSRLTSGKKSRNTPVSLINRQIWAIKKVSGSLRATCLPQALVLAYVLRNEKHIDLIVGVRKSPTFEAHAWVEKSGRILIGELPDATFQPLWTWQ